MINITAELREMKEESRLPLAALNESIGVL